MTRFLRRRWLGPVVRSIAILIAVGLAWLFWWQFGDGPIKVIRPNVRIPSHAWQIGHVCRSVIEIGHIGEGLSGPANEQLFWRSLETGRHIVDPTELKKCFPRLTRDENTLVAFQVDQPVRLFDRSTGKVRMTLPPADMSNPPQNSVVTPDDNTLVYSTIDKSVIVVDVPSGRIRHTLPNMHGPVAVSANGKCVACCDETNRMIIRHLDSHQMSLPLDCADGEGIRVVFLDDQGMSVLVITWDLSNARFEVWQEFGKRRDVLVSVPITSQFVPFDWITTQGRLLIVGPRRQERIWDISASTPTEVTNQLPAWYSHELSPDGKWLAMSRPGPDDWEWHLFDTRTFNSKGVIGHGRGEEFVFSPFGEVAAFREPQSKIESLAGSLLNLFGTFESTGNRRRFVNVESGALGRSLPGTVFYLLAFSPDNQSVWMADCTDSSLQPNGIVYRQWLMARRSPPWWLWLCSAAGVLVVLRMVFRRRANSRNYLASPVA